MKWISVDWMRSVAVVDLLLFAFLQFLVSFSSKRNFIDASEMTELMQSMSSCSQLISLSLTRLTCQSTVTMESEDGLAKALGLLLTKCQLVEFLSLEGFPLSGRSSRIQLPVKLKFLSLRYCTVRDSDWQHWNDMRATSVLRDLVVDRCQHIGGTDFGALLKFSRHHAATLSYMFLWPGMDGERPAVSFQRMAMHLTHLRQLQEFTYCTETASTMLKLMREVMPTVVGNENVCKFHIWSKWNDALIDISELVRSSLKTICSSRRSPIQSGSVRYAIRNV